jgi:hypothetical protein
MTKATVPWSTSAWVGQWRLMIWRTLRVSSTTTALYKDNPIGHNISNIFDREE